MYSGSGFSDWEIGDITVIIHKGVYHLFHLIIPNHDYIAHAVSKDGMSWRRVNNALFVGNPGEWDDDMLWTMHVCEVNGAFEMYYTGLQRKDRGVITRIGLATSHNLIDWVKSKKDHFPLEPLGIYYEASSNNPRKWLSFRDPFRFEYNNDVYLLICARTITGPLSRRGCIGLVKITDYQMELMPPLMEPLVYDDIECPCVFELDGRFYIIGSIREDVKIRYWFAPDFFGEYHSFHDDVLLPQGNYAARTVMDDGHLLVYNFFYTDGKVNSLRVLPPPKELDTDDTGRLILKSYYRWEKMVQRVFTQDELPPLRHLFANKTASSSVQEGKITCGSTSGYEIFCFDKPAASFIFEGNLTIEGMGKLGLVTDIDDEGSGYYISFDVSYGQVQIRAWGYNALNNRENFIFKNIQQSVFKTNSDRRYHFRLLRYGNYIELSIDGLVKLTLIDYMYSGKGIGFYSASSIISARDILVKTLAEPRNEYASQEEEKKQQEME